MSTVSSDLLRSSAVAAQESAALVTALSADPLQLEAPRAALPVAEATPLPAYDARACQELMRGGSKTFFAASLLLPTRVRAPACALYAFCRLADDEIDLGEDPLAALQGLHRRLDDVYAGRPQGIDVDRALASVLHRFGIPRELLDALLEGFMWDAKGRSYETLEDVMDYGARVAGTVGAMMALVMGARSPQALARACELGVAMQLTNIARDVGEDARNGRLYLPRAWLRELGIDPQAWLSKPHFNDAIARVVQRLLTAADGLYTRAEQGIAALPRDCRPAIHAARLVYAEIGRQIERQGLDSVSQRAVVSRNRKLALLARAAGTVLVLPADGQWAPAPLAAIAYLVNAASAAEVTAPLQAPAPARPRGLDERVGWVIELFERQRERQLRQQQVTH
jgi:15-cis-phytoene synthase